MNRLIRIFWRCVFCVLFCFVTFISIIPNPTAPDSGMDLIRWIASIFLGTPENADKVGHFLAYGALGFTSIGAKIVQRRSIWRIPVCLAIYGCCLEGVQLLGGVRDFNGFDAMANGLGAVAGCVGFWVLSTILPKRGLVSIFKL